MMAILPDRTLATPASLAIGGTVVVVDDDASIVEGLALLLDGWGYTVLTAMNLTQLDDCLRRRAVLPDLVVADHFLPGGETGVQAVELVRSHSGRPVPAIILTGDTTPERETEAAALGCRLLHKPVQVAPLRDAVDALIRC